jgi:tripartite-type tricarboxylate transporter receptor subunit TctC
MLLSFIMRRRSNDMRRLMIKGLLSLSVLALAWEHFLAPAHAESWPSKPIRIVVPFPPAGTTDQIARWMQPLLERELKTPVVIENRGGASGSIGTHAVVTSPADGYTFLMVFDTHAAIPALIPAVPYDTVNDLAPIMLIGKSPMVITAHASAPYKSFGDIISAAKQQPESVSYGTIGSGSLAHLAMTQLSNQLNVKLNHIPYKGGGPLTVDAIAGHVPTAIASVALLSPHIKAGKLVPLAVTSAERFPQLPDTPTLAELGVPGYDAQAWWGLLAPVRTPPEILTRMHEATVKALEDSTVKTKLGEQGLIYALSRSEEFGSFIRSEIARWSKVIKDNRINAGQ